MSVGGFPGLWADAAPGTAIRAPPASAAADPARNFRREVSDLLFSSLRNVPSLMDSLSFVPKAMIPSRYFITTRSIYALLLPPPGFTHEQAATFRRQANTVLAAGRAWPNRPRAPESFGTEAKAPCLWTGFVPDHEHLRKRGYPGSHHSAGSTRNRFAIGEPLATLAPSTQRSFSS